MAAALLQQLQKHNPDLLQNMIAQATGTPPSQQQPTTSTTPGPTIPPPPSNTAQNHTVCEFQNLTPLPCIFFKNSISRVKIQPNHQQQPHLHG
jgi:hypothetical protein